MPNPMNVRVVVKLPYNRPDHPIDDPPQIEWNAEKASILWEVIEKSRAVDNAGTDWKGLAEHLEVPLPYLLYRANARFQEELRGIRDIGILSPTTPNSTKGGAFPTGDKKLPIARTTGNILPLNSRSAPLSVLARLSALGNNTSRAKKPVSSSTLTLQVAKKPFGLLRPVSPSLSETYSDSDEDVLKEEEAERNAEEEEILNRKIQDLQKMMTTETLGLVSSRSNNKLKARDRGRSEPLSPRSLGSSRLDTLSNRSMSQSISSASSPRGSSSIPDIRSQSSGSLPHSPIGRDLSMKSSSPPAMSSRGAVGLVHRSSHGSEASSFSDLSDASISASVLESALLSNIGNNGSRFSQLSRTRAANRIHTVVPQ